MSSVVRLFLRFLLFIADRIVFAADDDVMYFVSMRSLVYVTLVYLRHILCFRRSFTKKCGDRRRTLAFLSASREPDVPHPAPNAEEEDIVLLSWPQVLWLLTRRDPLIRYTAWLHELEAALNYRSTVHKMMVMEQPERNILTDLREILLAADTDIPSSHVDTTIQRSLTLCNQLSTVNILAISYPLLAVLNVVDL